MKLEAIIIFDKKISIRLDDEEIFVLPEKYKITQEDIQRMLDAFLKNIALDWE